MEDVRNPEKFGMEWLVEQMAKSEDQLDASIEQSMANLKINKEKTAQMIEALNEKHRDEIKTAGEINEAEMCLFMLNQQQETLDEYSHHVDHVIEEMVSEDQQTEELLQQARECVYDKKVDDFDKKAAIAEQLEKEAADAKANVMEALLVKARDERKLSDIKQIHAAMTEKLKQKRAELAAIQEKRILEQEEVAGYDLEQLKATLDQRIAESDELKKAKETGIAENDALQEKLQELQEKRLELQEESEKTEAQLAKKEAIRDATVAMHNQVSSHLQELIVAKLNTSAEAYDAENVEDTRGLMSIIEELQRGETEIADLDIKKEEMSVEDEQLHKVHSEALLELDELQMELDRDKKSADEERNQLKAALNELKAKEVQSTNDFLNIRDAYKAKKKRLLAAQEADLTECAANIRQLADEPITLADSLLHTSIVTHRSVGSIDESFLDRVNDMLDDTTLLDLSDEEMESSAQQEEDEEETTENELSIKPSNATIVSSVLAEELPAASESSSTAGSVSGVSGNYFTRSKSKSTDDLVSASHDMDASSSQPSNSKRKRETEELNPVVSATSVRSNFDFSNLFGRDNDDDEPEKKASSSSIKKKKSSSSSKKNKSKKK